VLDGFAVKSNNARKGEVAEGLVTCGAEGGINSRFLTRLERRRVRNDTSQRVAAEGAPFADTTSLWDEECDSRLALPGFNAADQELC
jgi:hypothetical protein